MELNMHNHIIEDMVRKLGPVLKDKAKAHKILTRYWQNKMALVWDTEDVHRAANEWDLALTEKEAIQVLQALHSQHNAQYGIRWEDITTHTRTASPTSTARNSQNCLQRDGGPSGTLWTAWTTVIARLSGCLQRLVT